jgi:acyl-CoA thioesterase-1
VRARLRLLGLLGVVLLVASACTPHKKAAAKPTPSGAPFTYVAVGASESIGLGSTDPLRDAWPQLFYRTLPGSAVFVNVAVSGSTVAQALVDQVPPALNLSPGLVTVWLNVNDIIHGVQAVAYEPELKTLVTDLRRGGATPVLVANTPPLDQLPAYRACLAGKATPSDAFSCPEVVPPPATLDADVAAYNAATARVVAETGAILVDLHAAGLSARQTGTEASLVGPDGFHPSNAGHALVASTFATALATASRLPGK